MVATVAAVPASAHYSTRVSGVNTDRDDEPVAGATSRWNGQEQSQPWLPTCKRLITRSVSNAWRAICSRTRLSTPLRTEPTRSTSPS